MIVQNIIVTLLLCQFAQAVLATDDAIEIDKARVFPIQKNNTLIHSPSKSEEANNGSQTSFSPPVDSSKAAPKDSNLNINGNGGSANRAAGGNATFRKRFTFN